jgi:hypothetical protein
MADKIEYVSMELLIEVYGRGEAPDPPPHAALMAILNHGSTCN